MDGTEDPGPIEVLADNPLAAPTAGHTLAASLAASLAGAFAPLGLQLADLAALFAELGHAEDDAQTIRAKLLEVVAAEPAAPLADTVTTLRDDALQNPADAALLATWPTPYPPNVGVSPLSGLSGWMFQSMGDILALLLDL